MQTFGDAGSPTRAANDLHKLVRNFSADRLASLPFFYLDCGTEDGFLATNLELSTIFLERKIPHEYRQLPGAHNWAYWDSQVQEVLKIAARKMNINRVANSDTNYHDTRKTLESFQALGFSVQR
jgi:S-formylglutathione hydrolase FrmB